MLSKINLNTSSIEYARPQSSIKANRSVQGRSRDLGQLSFSGGVSNYITNPVLALNVLPKINDPALKTAYLEVYKAADSQGKSDLKFLLDTGKLFSNDADDGSNTLQNLQRIIKEPRANGLNTNDIINSTLRALANPYSITQDFGKLSPAVANMAMQNPQYAKISSSMGLDSNVSQKTAFMAQTPQNVAQPAIPAEFNVESSGTCVAASMEFNLADKRPAEFARYAADLSSPKMAVWEDIKFGDIHPNTLTAMYWLSQFNVEYEADDFDGGKALLKPDQAAIYRAISQTQSRKPGTRSALDVLMQSTFMQLGSAHSYNSLTDIRTGGFNQSNRGLTEFEKSMAEAIVDDKGGKSSVTYQIVDDKAYLVGYTKAHQQTLMDIINSLKAGFNVIVGITETDGNAHINGGHEITIVASKIGKDGKLYFVCNDTDDDKDVPVEMRADELIPKIHHAGIPNVVLQNSQQQEAPKPITIQIPAQVQPQSAQNIPQQFNSVLNAAAAQKNSFSGKVNNQVKKNNLNVVV